jgi:hypothetical protein
VAYHQRRIYDKAIDSYNKALLLNPEDSKIRREIDLATQHLDPLGKPEKENKVALMPRIN